MEERVQEFFFSPGSTELVNSIVTSCGQFADFNSIHLQGAAEIFRIIAEGQSRGSMFF